MLKEKDSLAGERTQVSEEIRAIALGYYNQWLKGEANYSEFSRLGDLANKVAEMEKEVV